MGYNVQRDLIKLLDYEMDRRGLSQAELAEATGISRKHISGVLTGRAQASVALWQRLLDAAGRFDVAPDPGDGGGVRDGDEVAGQ